ncbi:MAG: hypothetical protein M3354_09050, partial [Chloroflexota bacterium]|nr:hypothetical protein [Chloroflexota bacterium]
SHPRLPRRPRPIPTRPPGTARDAWLERHDGRHDDDVDLSAIAFAIVVVTPYLLGSSIAFELNTHATIPYLVGMLVASGAAHAFFRLTRRHATGREGDEVNAPGA